MSPSLRADLSSGGGGRGRLGDFHLPAVNHDGPGFGGVEELDLADKAQEASGIAGDAVVGPAGEVEEAELPDLVVAFLRREWASVPAAAAPHMPWPAPRGTTAAALRNQSLAVGEARPSKG